MQRWQTLLIVRSIFLYAPLGVGGYVHSHFCYRPASRDTHDQRRFLFYKFKIMKKPQPEDYGYQTATGFDSESGWMEEGGEEAYYEDLEKWNKTWHLNNKQHFISCGDKIICEGAAGTERNLHIWEGWEENKHLLLAAPEMLEALEEMTSSLKKIGSVYQSFPAFLKMQDAIKKAKGE